MRILFINYLHWFLTVSHLMCSESRSSFKFSRPLECYTLTIVLLIYIQHDVKRICLWYSGDSDIASTVINESEAEGEEARKFLEDVRETFPQVCKKCVYFMSNFVVSSNRVLSLYFLLANYDWYCAYYLWLCGIRSIIKHVPSVKFVIRFWFILSTHILSQHSFVL